ncbi:MAG: DUF4358 domain-containing protein [Oscillospiraceae bacterium]|nr:DUF4358 domain-containing protein [Oscillospiraceae bacterium]
MKKLLCLLLCAATVLSLAACGKSETQKEVDLKAVAAAAVEELTAQGAMLIPEENPDYIEGVYPGLTAVETKQLVVYFPPVIGFACEIVMVEVASGDDVEAVRGILQARIDDAADDTFYAENAEGWKNGAEIYVNGNFVVLCALPADMTAPAALKAEF